MSDTPESTQDVIHAGGEPMVLVSLRLAPNLWEKCAWEGAQRGQSRSAFVRDVLRYATRDTRPRQGQKLCELRATDAEWAEWLANAEHAGSSIEALMRELQNFYATQVRGVRSHG